MRNRSEKMDKCLALAAMLALLAGPGCATFQKKPAGGVEHQSGSVRFMGYKVSVRLKASPEQVDQYLTDPTVLGAKNGGYQFRTVSRDTIKQVGQNMDCVIEVAGIGFPVKFTVVLREPGEKLWLIGESEIGIMAMVRFDSEKSGDGTRLTMRFEMEDINTALGELAKAINVQEAMAKVLDQSMANMQVHFDPSLKTKGLLAEGVRGEFFDTFYQQHQAGVMVYAAPAKVRQVLADSKTWSELQSDYNLGVTPCFDRNPEACPRQIRFLAYDVSRFPSAYPPADSFAEYWVSNLFIARINFSVRPENQNSRLSFSYTTELPSGVSPETADLFMNLMQVPASLGRALLEIKSRAEELT